VISVEFARAARTTLEGASFRVDYRESDVAHQINPGDVPAAVEWLSLL